MLFFVDLRAAFDSVDKSKLLGAMRERGMKEELVRRCEDILGKTCFRIRVGEELEEEFWTGREVRQGYSLNPLLFNLLVADLEDEMKRGN